MVLIKLFVVRPNFMNTEKLMNIVYPNILFRPISKTAKRINFMLSTLITVGPT